MNSKELLKKLIIVINSKKRIKRYVKARNNLDVMRQSACLVLNPIMVYRTQSRLIAMVSPLIAR